MPTPKAIYCHACAAARQIFYPLQADPLTSTYQWDKYAKHTVPDPTEKLQSIFHTASTQGYADYLIDTQAAGAVEVDARGRINIILAAGKEVGLRFEHGKPVAPEDAIKVVLTSEAGLVHGFTIASGPFSGATCADCGRGDIIV
jgi:hypothetical protein